MAVSDIQPGMEASQQVVVAPEHFASRIVNGTPDVFSTPALGGLVEKAAAEWLAGHLDDGQLSVGAQIVINHTAATPEGLTVTANVTVSAVEGRRVDFSWTATDGVDDVGNGTHTRFVADKARFDERLNAKRPK